MSQTMRKQRIVWVLLGMALLFFGQVGQAVATADVSAGNLLLDAPTAAVGMIKSGGDRLIHRYGTSNFFAGKEAGNLTLTGVANVGVGESALTSLTSGSYNTATGTLSLYTNTTGGHNTATGALSLYLNTTGTSNTAAGYGALAVNTTGNNNVATGLGSISANTTGSDNTATGTSSLSQNTTGSNNTATGTSSLSQNTTGGYNTATGLISLYQNTTGAGNTAMGPASLYTNTTGGYNTSLGYSAGYSNSTGSNNTFLGTNAGNVGSANNLTNATAIGYNTQVTASNTVILGSGANVGIGTTAPTHKLTVIGNATKSLGGTSWAVYSDTRLKTIAGTFDAGLNEVLKLQPIRYRYKKDNPLHLPNESEHIGFSAQEVQKIIPGAISENSQGYLMLNSDPILWAMLNAIKELTAKVSEMDTLKVQLKELQDILRPTMVKR